jgi:small subunit ribosomal protein S8
MDPISNRVTTIQNAQRASRTRVNFSPRTGCNASHSVYNLLSILRDEGFIEAVEKVITKNSIFPSLRVHLKYGPQGEPAIRRLFRISTIGRRVYAPSAAL